MVDEHVETDFNLEKGYEETLKDIQEETIVKSEVIDMDNETVFLDFGYKSEAKVPIEEFDEKPNIGDEVDLFLIRLENNAGEPVVSKKRCDIILEREELKNKIENKEVVKGTVHDVKNGGIIVKYNSIYGFIPFSLYALQRVEKKDINKNETIEFYIDRLDRGKNRNKNKNRGKNDKNKVEEEFIGNRKKYLIEERNKKRDEIFSSLKEGDIVEGVVDNITNFGAFIDIGSGIHALLRIRDVSWIKINKIEDVMSKGDHLKVMVLSVNPEKRKIAVGLKQTEEEPWEKFLKKFNEGDVVKGTVSSITSYGAFVKIIDGVEGLLHISELSWTKNVKSPKEMISEGQQVEVKILEINRDEQKISLSLKHLFENPWDKVAEKYPVDAIVTGRIVTITSFGAFIELEEGIEALIHKNDISWLEDTYPADYFKQDQEVQCKIIQCDVESRKIRAGIKQLGDDPWREVKKNISRDDEIQCEVLEVDEENGLLVKYYNDLTTYIPFSLLEFGKPEEIKSRALGKYNTGDKINAIVKRVDDKNRDIELSIKDYDKMKERKKVKEFLHDSQDDATFTLGDLMKLKNDN